MKIYFTRYYVAMVWEMVYENVVTVWEMVVQRYNISICDDVMYIIVGE